MSSGSSTITSPVSFNSKDHTSDEDDLTVDEVISHQRRSKMQKGLMVGMSLSINIVFLFEYFLLLDFF